jgi:biopolymer transport protein ExbD
MRFLVRKRHATPAVIIVALIDVLIVLVIFLLVTATFKQKEPPEPALKLVLPQSTHAQQAGVGDDTTLVVSIDAKGNFRFGEQGGRTVTEDQLRSQLMSSTAKQSDVKLVLRADKTAPFGQIVKVIDLAKDAKIKSLSTYTEKPGKP